jgi:hypothetical protein
VLIPLLLVAIGWAVRWPLIHHGTPFYTADMAIIDLMARHFARGEFSIYYWGQNYYGVLDPLLLIPLFKIFGFDPRTSQMLPFLFTGVFLVLYHRFVAKTSDARTAHIATLILSVGSPYFLWNTFETYGYIISMSLGLLSLFALDRIKSGHVSTGHLFGYGIFLGFCWYYFRLIGIFWAGWLVSAFLPELREWIQAIRSSIKKLALKDILLLKRVKLPSGLRYLLILLNIVNVINLAIAVILWLHGDWISTVQGHTVKLFFRPILESSVQMTFGALVVVFWRPLWNGLKECHRRWNLGYLAAGIVVGYAPSLVGSLTGHKPTTNASFIALPTIVKNVDILWNQMFPFVLNAGVTGIMKFLARFIFAAGLIVLVREVIRSKRPHPFAVMAALNLIIVLFLMRLGNENNARYLSVFYIALAFGIARWARQAGSKWVWLTAPALSLFLCANVIANRAVLQQAPPGAPYRDIAQALAAQPIRAGYADLWLAYPITAQTDETVILAPIGDEDRYPPYTRYVQSLQEIIVVGEQPLPVNSHMMIKGLNYRVQRVDTVSGQPVMRLEKLKS